MDKLTLMKDRHSVRAYLNKPIEGKVKEQLENVIKNCNQESGLHIQLILDEPKAFDSFMAHYGNFKGVKNYIALVGKRNADLDEKCGYYGEKIVLEAQNLGLNTCWVALTYRKVSSVIQIEKDEKLYLVIAIGYGESQGKAHTSKSIEKVMNIEENVPEWFERGVEAALLAPTALNQQKFVFSLKDNKVHVKAGIGFYTKVDLGIVKYHFEQIAGKENFEWE